MPFFKKTAHNRCSVALCAVLVPILTFSLGANLVTLVCGLDNVPAVIAADTVLDDLLHGITSWRKPVDYLGTLQVKNGYLLLRQDSPRNPV